MTTSRRNQVHNQINNIAFVIVYVLGLYGTASFRDDDRIYVSSIGGDKTTTSRGHTMIRSLNVTISHVVGDFLQGGKGYRGGTENVFQRSQFF